LGRVQGGIDLEISLPPYGEAYLRRLALVASRPFYSKAIHSNLFRKVVHGGITNEWPFSTAALLVLQETIPPLEAGDF
jgi:hypothetical protein